MNKKLFYFDLEETLINSFYNPVFCNQDKIEKFIKDNDIKEIGIFSAAIFDIRDKGYFIEYIKEGIEKRYNIKIIDNRIIMLHQVSEMFMEDLAISMDVSEMLSLYTKAGAFYHYCNFVYKKDNHCILLDDVFDNMILINHNKKLTVEVVNVKEIVLT